MALPFHEYQRKPPVQDYLPFTGRPSTLLFLWTFWSFQFFIHERLLRHLIFQLKKKTA
jgi:hypothetical protein